MGKRGLEDRSEIALPPPPYLISGPGRRRLLSPGSRITTCVFEGGASAGLQAGGQGHHSAPPGPPAFASPIPRVGGGENPPAITLHRAGYTVTPGGSWAPLQGDPRGPLWALVPASHRASEHGGGV